MVSNMTVNFTPKGTKPNLSTTNICSLEKCGYCTCSSSYCIPLQICIRTSYQQNNLDLKNYSFRKEEKMLTSQIFYQCRRARMEKNYYKTTKDSRSDQSEQDWFIGWLVGWLVDSSCCWLDVLILQSCVHIPIRNLYPLGDYGKENLQKNTIKIAQKICEKM